MNTLDLSCAALALGGNVHELKKEKKYEAQSTKPGQVEGLVRVGGCSLKSLRQIRVRTINKVKKNLQPI